MFDISQPLTGRSDKCKNKAREHWHLQISLHVIPHTINHPADVSRPSHARPSFVAGQLEYTTAVDNPVLFLSLWKKFGSAGEQNIQKKEIKSKIPVYIQIYTLLPICRSLYNDKGSIVEKKYGGNWYVILYGNFLLRTDAQLWHFVWEEVWRFNLYISKPLYVRTGETVTNVFWQTFRPLYRQNWQISWDSSHEFHKDLYIHPLGHHLT